MCQGKAGLPFPVNSDLENLEQFTNEMSELLWASAVAASGVRLETALIECGAGARLRTRCLYKIKVNLV